ncbi:hypothetical protein E4U54_006756 [Claviceps lovelessii]|nr:hypothetical protein E4U54_006756 [Claviceps lovelessii]
MVTLSSPASPPSVIYLSSIYISIAHRPLDHVTSYRRESKTLRQWRFRQLPAHPLPSSRQRGRSTLEVSFRDMLLIKDTSWLRDHCIEGDIIFPCAGCNAMSGEGIRHITASGQDKAGPSWWLPLRFCEHHSAYYE